MTLLTLRIYNNWQVALHPSNWNQVSLAVNRYDKNNQVHINQYTFTNLWMIWVQNNQRYRIMGLLGMKCNAIKRFINIADYLSFLMLSTTKYLNIPVCRIR